MCGRESGWGWGEGEGDEWKERGGGGGGVDMNVLVWRSFGLPEHLKFINW